MSASSPPPLPALPEVHVDDVDRTIQRGIVDRVYSASACIASVGPRIFHRAVYGSITTPPPVRKVTHATLFDLASLSKPLGAGLAALYLVGRNRLDVDAPLAQVVPAFKNIAQFAPLRVSMLLDHTAGFTASPPPLKPGQTYVQAIAEHPLAYTPESQTLYSDVGFMVLGWAIEHVTGKPLDVFLENEIYKPLHVHTDLLFIRHTDPTRAGRLRGRSIAATEQCPLRSKLMHGEVHDPHAWHMGGVAGHAGLFGTADAVWRVCAHLLQACRGQSPLFHASTVQRFWTRSKRPAETTRTLGWDTPSAQHSQAGQRFARTSVGHLGFTGCSLWIDHSKNVIAVHLANAVHPTAEGKAAAMRALRPRIYEGLVKAAQGSDAL